MLLSLNKISIFKILKTQLFTSTISNKMKFNFKPELKGIKKIEKSLFEMTISLPAIKVKKHSYSDVRKLLREFAFDSVTNFKKYQELKETDPLCSTHKYMLLDPDSFKINQLDDKIKQDLLKLLNEDEKDLNLLIENLQIQVGYDDLKFEDVIKAIIPDNLLTENVNVKGYSIIGHIAHFNLRDKILDYKNIIGQTLLDKMPHLKTVVNKLNSIDNTYRNFQFEILAGINDTNVQTKENGCFFKFDFAKVYWNPRLGTEHERIVNMLNQNDVLYDVFAGVGPFSVPAITKRKVSYVICNDLNPESYRHLLENYKSNNKSKTKTKQEEIKKLFLKQTNKNIEQLFDQNFFKFDPLQSFIGFNLDGREFIQKKLKYHLIELIRYRSANKINIDNKNEFGKFYVLMNLPAMSIEFLDAFKSLYNFDESIKIKSNLNDDILDKFQLNIYCYHFAKSEKADIEQIKERIANEIFNDQNLFINSKFVRKVAPNKDMFCSMFTLKFSHFLTTTESNGKKKINQVDDSTENYNKPTKIVKVDE
jgi:tRNA (guanine37-N1)-methyltransferase